jgi:hypothetical protein
VGAKVATKAIARHNENMRKWSARTLILAFVLVGCSGGGLTGKYHMQQQRDDLGGGVGQVQLDLREDHTYTITAGQAEWFVGTWTQKGDYLEISSSNQNIGTMFRIWKGELFPYANGKEIPGWNWTK